MNTSYLLLWMEAPLQSWGADSKFGRRDTLNFPTKSGILGLLLCAMGASGPQRELLAELSPLRLTVISFHRSKRNDEDNQIEQPPILMDFHMVGSGYDERDPWQTMHIPKTFEGKKAVGGGTKMTYRYYLQDARFVAIMEIPSKRTMEIGEAMLNPVFDLYLGRKHCVPTDLIYRGVYKEESEALAKAQEIAASKDLHEVFRVVEGEEDGETMLLKDVPIQFGPTKLYGERRVSVIQSG
jgi:CRISPR system Cascade subunit CasD